jgi:hypothetical protein
VKRREERVIWGKCRCGASVRYGNGGKRQIRKGDIRCWGCEMVYIMNMLKKSENVLDKGEQM